MKNIGLLVLVVALTLCYSCSEPSSGESTQPEKEPSAPTYQIEKHLVSESPMGNGYYLSVLPKSGNIKGVLVLLAGFGQLPEQIFPETELQDYAYENDLLTIGYAGRVKLCADEFIRTQMNEILTDVIDWFDVDPEKFVFGGFSAGGNLALRYVELCKEFPEKYPVDPQGVFMIDAPIDLFHAWDTFERILSDSISDVAVQEANMVLTVLGESYGKPTENMEVYGELTPFSMNPAYGQNEIYLKDVAVRAYHDVDIPWRLINRNQSVIQQNFFVTAELINRLLLMGNTRAEFIQTYQTGYRSNGERHPHSWSIVDEEECINWVKLLLE